MESQERPWKTAIAHVGDKSGFMEALTSDTECIVEWLSVVCMEQRDPKLNAARTRGLRGVSAAPETDDGGVGRL